MRPPLTAYRKPPVDGEEENNIIPGGGGGKKAASLSVAKEKEICAKWTEEKKKPFLWAKNGKSREEKKKGDPADWEEEGV